MAGAQFAMSLLERLREAYSNQPIGDLATELLREIESDFKVLRAIAGKHESSSPPIKQAAGWLAEKASQLKLRCSENNPLGTFEALEFLALGVYGKLKLWQVLSVLSKDRPELRDIDYPTLIARAEAQHDKLELRRRDLALNAFGMEVRSKLPE